MAVGDHVRVAWDGHVRVGVGGCHCGVVESGQRTVITFKQNVKRLGAKIEGNALLWRTKLAIKALK